ncbi:molybdenum cofactor guanylyltransferase [Neobacillus notoginsengisoli]|uniref:Probable molybdenum cofactor guanylyltransferase n=1 Tax=Neobacillus notoginsengisoli TaxID=1578198 RepID=A0A417YT75_9BACI|nr:molybdenum cofactor guanylyltransferase [Neobacillus notoginsengisoli]RHW40257.1 molybdenum cofactor guanylyltransferase [Neobacillus notoginsengisoli]
MKATAILLSGGKSSRMGTNKALLKIQDKTNIERIKDELIKIFDEVILVTNDPEAYEFLQINTITDEYPGQGPLAGIHAGLKASSSDANLAVACDMPFVSAELAESMIKRLGHHDAVIPVIEGRQHPLFAVYQKTIVQEIEECIKSDSLRLKALLEKLDVLYLTEQDLEIYSNGPLDRIFFNMNVPEEYELAVQQAKGKEQE